MLMYMKAIVAASWAAVAVSAIWVGAFLNWSLHRTEAATVNLAPSTVNHEPSTVAGPFVASTLDKKKQVYHLPTCSYSHLMEHPRTFESESAAQEAGYEPCSRCLSTSRLTQSAPPAPRQ